MSDVFSCWRDEGRNVCCRAAVNVSDQNKDESQIRDSHVCNAFALLSPSHDRPHMGGKKKSSLHTALLNQQSRLKQKAEIAQAAKSSEKARAVKKQAGKKAVTIPFAPTDKILLIGEGNFSFGYALAVNPPVQLQHLPPENITATAYDTEEECFAKYVDAREKIDALRGKGVNLIFGVDATGLEKVPQLKGKRWDKIVWNFPHAGQCVLCFRQDDREQVPDRRILQGRESLIRIGISFRINS